MRSGIERGSYTPLAGRAAKALQEDVEIGVDGRSCYGKRGNTNRWRPVERGGLGSGSGRGNCHGIARWSQKTRLHALAETSRLTDADEGTGELNVATAIAIAEETKIADAHEAIGKNVHEEAP